MKYKVTVDLSGIFLPNQENLEFLSEIGICPEVRQRKSYDEYYLIDTNLEVELSFSDIQKLSQVWNVGVSGSTVYLS